MIRVGLKNAVIAPLTKDVDSIESKSGNPEITYGSIIKLPDVQSLELTASVQSTNVDQDDSTDFIEQCTGYSGSITRSSFSPDELAIILAEKKMNNITVSTSNDEAPYFALGFQSKLQGSGSDGNILCMWVLKTKFSQSNFSAQSRGTESLTPQPDSISFKSTNRKADGAWRFYTRTNNAEEIKNFFTQETLQMLADAASQTYTNPVCDVVFAEVLPESGEAGFIYIVSDAAYYWDGHAFQNAKSE